MKNLKAGLFSLLMTSFLLTGCGNNIGSMSSLDTRSVSVMDVDQPSANNLTAINNAIDFSTGTRNTLNNTNVKMYIDGSEAFPALQDMILSAKESIYIEIFIFKNDHTGQKFADALIRKVKEGVDVKFLYDYVGNGDVKLINYMAQNGVQVETYNKGVLTSKGTNITHRKIYLVDGIKAMTGGMNIGDEYSTGEWHDTMVGFEGDAVKSIMKELFIDWKRAGGKITTPMQATMNKTLMTVAEDQKKLPLRLTVTSPLEPNKKDGIKRMLFSAIESAKDNIKISMPYFSDDTLVERLILAEKRGVKVSVVLPKKNNSSVFDMVSTTTANQLIKGNVDVFRSGATNNTFDHSKVMTVDNIWTTIGSCNADYRALNENQELNIAISEPEFTQEFNKRYFDIRIADSEKGVFKNIPWYKKPVYAFLEGIDKLL